MSDVAYDPIGHRQAGMDTTRQLLNTFYTSRAGAQLARGDRTGAQQTFNRAGQFENASAVQTQDREAKARELQASLQIARALKGVREQGGDVVAALDSYRPVLNQFGVDEASFGNIRQLIATDPTALDKIEQMAGTQMRELSFQKRGADVLVFEQGNPDPIRTFEATPEPIVVGGVLVDPATYQPVLDTRRPEYQTVRNADGSTDVVAIDQPQPVSMGGGSAPPAPATVDGVALLQEIIPNVSFNSGRRTPEQNRAAGGVPNSFHVSGQAVDIPPQSGTTPAQLRQQLEARGLQVEELIDEGDHWHIAWKNGGQAPNFGQGEAPRSGGGSRVVAQGNAGAGARILSAQEVEQAGFAPGTVAEASANGQVRVLQQPRVGAGGRAGTPRLNNQDQRRLTAATDNAEAGAAAAADARRFIQLNRDAGTGAVTAGPLGAVASLNPTYAEMRAIAARMAPAMRQAGSGAMSDRDLALYQRSTLALGNPGPTNQAIADVIIAGADRAQQRAEFLEDFARQNGSLLGAQEEWGRYVNANPLFTEQGGNTVRRPNVPTWREFMGQSGRQGGGQAAPTERRQSPVPNVPQQLWATSSPQQQQYWQANPPSGGRGTQTNPLRLDPRDPRRSYGNVPRGSYYLGPDGQVRIKQ